MTELTPEQLQKWYRHQMKKKSKDFVKQAEKSYKIVQSALKDIESVSRDLKESDEDDEDANMTIAARFALKINDIVENFYVSKDITYDSTESLVDEIQQFISGLWGAGARWIRRLDKKHKNTVKQLDVYMKELMREVKRLGKLLYEFSWLKDLERIGNRIETLEELSFSKQVYEEQIKTVKLKIKQARQELQTAEDEYLNFKQSSNVSDLLSLDDEADHLSTLLRMQLNPLKKQVKKFLQQDTGVRVAPDGQRALLDYWEEPYTIIAEEPDGYPALISGLMGLKEAIERDKLSLKDRLARRALEEIEEIKDGSLKEIQTKAKEIEKRRSTFAGSDVYSKNDELAAAVDEATKNLEYHQNDLLRIRDDIQREVDRVEDYRKRIESEILEKFDEKVKLRLDISLEPLLAECVVQS